MTAASRLRDIWQTGDTRIATLASVVSGALWASCLAFPGDTLARPTYKLMAFAAAEHVWFFIFAGLAVMQTWRLLTDPKGALGVYAEHVIKLAAAFVWTYTALACMFAQYPPAAAVSDTVVVAALTWWDFFQWDEKAPRR